MSPVLVVLGFVLAFVLGLYFTPLARQAALRFGIVDTPDGKLKQQVEPVPYLGGLAVFLAYLVALGLVFSFNGLLLGLLLAGTLTLLVGLVDDFGVLTPAAKIAGQAIAVFVLLRSGAVIELAEVPQGLRWPLAARETSASGAGYLGRGGRVPRPASVHRARWPVPSSARGPWRPSAGDVRQGPRSET